MVGFTEHYMDLSQSMLHVKANIVGNSASNLPRDAPVGPVNLLLHALLSEVDVTLNDKLISSFNSTYPYRALLETLLTYGPGAKTS